MTIQWIEEKDITAIDNMLPQTVCPVTGISNTHQVLTFSPGNVFYRSLSCFCIYPEICPCYQPRKLSFESFSCGVDLNPKQHHSASSPHSVSVQIAGATHPKVPGNDTSSDEEHNFTVEMFVIVKYDERPYAGQVTQTCGDEVEIN